MAGRTRREHDHTVWALLYVAEESERSIADFFVNRRFCKRVVRSNLHMTVYHARRELDGLKSHTEPVEIAVPAECWRFMTMTPGGENPRPGIDPGGVPVGVRLQRSAAPYAEIQALRARFYAYETPTVIGTRSASSQRISAFGARHFQPHISLLRSGSGVAADLRQIGSIFRAALPPIRFDRLVIRCRSSNEA